MKRRNRVGLIFLGMLALAASALFTLTWQKLRQGRLNRALIQACRRADDRAAIRLLMEGADPNCRYDPHSPTTILQVLKDWLSGKHRRPRSLGWTPLGLAAGGNYLVGDGSIPENTALVTALLRYRADVNLPVLFDGDTALFQAVEAFRPATIHLLLANGARVDPRLSEAMLKLCSTYEDFTVIPDLVAHGANADTVLSSGRTLLMEASARGDLSAVKVLLAHHANARLKNDYGETA